MLDHAGGLRREGLRPFHQGGRLPRPHRALRRRPASTPTRIPVPEDLPSIEIRDTGVLSAEDVAESVREAVETARRTGRRRFLTDCTGLQGGHSSAGLDQLAKEVQAAVATSGFREALLVPENGDDRNRERVLFWESTCRKRGLEVRTWTDRSLALERPGTAP